MKNKTINIRVSEFEKELILKKAKRRDLKVAQYMLHRIFLDRDLTHNEREQLESILINLRKIGININQIARELNAGKYKHENQLKLDEIQDTLTLTIQEIRELSKLMSKIL